MYPRVVKSYGYGLITADDVCSTLYDVCVPFGKSGCPPQRLWRFGIDMSSSIWLSSLGVTVNQKIRGIISLRVRDVLKKNKIRK